MGGSLGPQVCHWMYVNLSAPDKTEHQPFLPTEEQQDFAYRFYELDDRGKRIIRRAVYSRPKGAGKSPWLAALAAAEGAGPVLFDHWAVAGEVNEWGYEFDEGEPVGKPWRSIRTPLVNLLAVSEEQTRNSWTPLLEMMGEGSPIRDNYPGLEPLETFVNLPGGGKMLPATSSARSREGARIIFAVMDQTETWTPATGGVRLADTVRRNLGKTGGTSIESPNAYIPGEGSVAEKSADYWKNLEEGRARQDGLLYDHREAPAVALDEKFEPIMDKDDDGNPIPVPLDLANHDQLLRALRVAYGCASSLPCVIEGHDHEPGWVDLERIIAEMMDPDTSPQDARRYYLNQITYASDSFLAHHEVQAVIKPRVVARGEAITLGFDGSRGQSGNTKRKPDATALIGTCLSDGYQFAIGIWEAEDGPGQEFWEPPIPEIDAAVDSTFTTYNVVAFYADPAKEWRSKVNEWEAKYGKRVKVKVGTNHPFEWWMVGGRSVFIQRAVEAYGSAFRNLELTIDGAYRFVAHLLNARRRISHQKLTLGKENEYSPNKIDACVAGVLSWQARLDCIAAGVKTTRQVAKSPVRLR